MFSSTPSLTRVALHTTELTCTQPSIVQHTTGKLQTKWQYVNASNAWLSKQTGAVVCKASSVVCRGSSWEHLCSVVCRISVTSDCVSAWPTNRSCMLGCVLGAWPTNRSGTAINQEHDIVQKNNWICLQWFYLTVGPILVSCGFQPQITSWWIEFEYCCQPCS